MRTHRTRSRGLYIVFSLMTAVAVVPTAVVAAPPQQTTPSARELVVTVGKSLIVTSAANIERVSLGFGDVADARVVSPTEVLLNGKAPGETTLIIWQVGGNKLFFDLIVRPNVTAARTKLETVKQDIEKYLPGQAIQVSVDNDTLFLQGSVKDLNASERAVAIASSAYPKVVNLLFAEAPATEPQILLKVQFASLDRSVTTELGMNLLSTGATNTIGRVSTGQFPSATITPQNPGSPTTLTISDALNIFLLRPDLNLAATIKALENKGLAEILAEPNVLAINGKQANFLAGGEFPYPILQGGGGGLGAVTVAFRQFGVKIDFLPLITSRGTIRLAVAPEVSSLDSSAGLNIQGFNVPGLATRRVETEIELQSGQSFVIGGLLDRRLSETIERIPLLASIPLLGNLFKSKSLNKSNNELLVLITPEIVHPIPQTTAAPKLDFPLPLWGPDKQMRTPGVEVTGTPQAGGPQVPVEQLQRSIKSQNEMRLEPKKDLNTYPGEANPLMLPTAPATAAPATPIKQ